MPARDHAKCIANCLRELADRIESMSVSEIEKCASGEARIVLVLEESPKDLKRSGSQPATSARLGEARTSLDTMTSREEGEQFLAEHFPGREGLVSLAKAIDVRVTKKDNVGKLRERIIEATIGYRLRSAAIQGRGPSE